MAASIVEPMVSLDVDGRLWHRDLRTAWTSTAYVRNLL